MGGGKKQRKAAAKAAATSKATTAAPADQASSDPCEWALPELHAAVTATADSSWRFSGPLRGQVRTALLSVIAFTRDSLSAAAQDDAQDGPTILRSERAVAGLVMALKLELQLISKWLSARKRPRDWKQEDYSTAVTSAMETASCVLGVHVQQKQLCADDKPIKLGQAPAVYGRVNRQHLLDQTAAAQQEVCQLLQAALKQQQHGQQAAQDAAQQLEQLQKLALGLLRFWTVLDGMWSDAYSDADPAQALAAQKPALELAVVLAQSLTADDPNDTFLVLFSVAVRANDLTIELSHAKPAQAAQAAATVQLVQPGLLHLSLIMLLVHTHGLQAQAVQAQIEHVHQQWLREQCTPDTEQQDYAAVETPSDGPVKGVVGTLGDDSQPAPHGSGDSGTGPSAHSKSDSTSSSSPDVAPASKLEALGQQQFDQLTAVIRGLWQQLGMAPEALPAFGAALRSDPRSFVEDPDIIEYTALCVLTSLQHIMGLNKAQVLRCVRSDAAHSGVSFDQLSRQLQQLLLCIVWRLPQLLLQSALVSNSAEDAAVHVGTLVHAALASVQAWNMPGLLSAASAVSPLATTTAAPSAQAHVPTRLSHAELLSDLHGAWLCVLSDVLLQPEHGLLYTAAAAKVEVVGSLTCACPRARAACTATLLDDLPSQSCSSFEVDCNRLDAMACLMRLSQELAAAAAPGMPPGSTLLSSHVWYQRAPSLLLMLEALTRGVLPHHVLCSSCKVKIRTVNFPSIAAQHLHLILGDFVGSSSSGMLVKLCVNILQHGSSLSAQQDPLQPQQQHSWQEQQQPQASQQQQRLLHLWSLIASLLKLPIRNVTGVPLITGCTAVATVGLEAMQLIMQHAAADLSALQKRMVFAPWLVLTGRCLSAQARLLRRLLDLPAPKDLSPLIECFVALKECLLRLRLVLADCAAASDNGSSSGGSDGSSGSGSSSSHPARQGPAVSGVLQELQQQLQDKNFAARAAHALVANNSDVSLEAQETGYSSLTAYSNLEYLDAVLGGQFLAAQGFVTGFVELLQLADEHVTGWNPCDTITNSSKRSSSRRSSSIANRAYEQSTPDLNEAVAAIRASKTPHECWGHLATVPNMQLSLMMLQSVGQLLCTQLPMPWLCNNPECTNLSGVSELQLVGGKACVCGGCGVARYCSQECQASYWPHHQFQCQIMATAAAAAAGNDASTYAATAAPAAVGGDLPC